MPRTRGPIIVLLAAIALAACQEDSDSPPGEAGTKGDRNTITFQVDDDGVSYLYRHPSRGLHGAARLSDIPLEHRVAVIVVTSERGSPSFDARSFPVANLLGASPGDDATATWLSKRTFVQRNLASTLGHERAIGVRFWAQEVTQLSPNSDRARSSDRALRLLEETPQPSEGDESAIDEDTP